MNLTISKIHCSKTFTLKATVMDWELQYICVLMTQEITGKFWEVLAIACNVK